MHLRLLLLGTLGLTACVPWNEIHGPLLGGGLVYQAGRGFSPQLTTGYGYERYRGWYGYGADVQVTVEPWRRRLSVTPLLRGRLIWFSMAAGPTVVWSPEGTTVGLVVESGAMVALGAGSTCEEDLDPPGCLDEDDTVYPTHLPRLHYRGVWLRGAPSRLQFGADLLLSQYWLRHGERQPDEND
jgi:hypothetical protein